MLDWYLSLCNVLFEITFVLRLTSTPTYFMDILAERLLAIGRQILALNPPPPPPPRTPPVQTCASSGAIESDPFCYNRSWPPPGALQPWGMGLCVGLAKDKLCLESAVLTKSLQNVDRPRYTLGIGP